MNVSFPAQVQGLERFVQDASTHVDQRLIDLLFNKFSLYKHCDAIKRYMLLGQGDFVQALMDMASVENNLNA
jgi:gamma-tubulin complex component 3